MESKHKLRHRFDIIRKLGQGTYGKVQLAVNKETGQEVAIKTIKKSKIENEQDAVRIRREIQIMSSIRHPNIVHIYEVFENKDKIVLVMQNASGGELYEYLSERKVLNDAEARRIFRQVVAAVYYIHKNKICHRDLKLENILLDEKGNAKIADFGLSNVYDEKGLLSTFCGSPLYASPEIVKGLPYFGPEVDCWSLGVLLYTLVYGAMPFDGSNFKKLVKQISNGDYFEPKLRSAASGLIRHLLTVNASERASIIDVCSNDWVNETYDTQLLQVAEDLANLSPVRLDLLIALQPQSSTNQIDQSSQQQQQPSSPSVTNQIPGGPGALNGKLPPTAPPTDRATEFSQNSTQDQVLPSPSLMRMPSLSVKNCASLGTLRSSSSASSVKSALSVEMRAGESNHSDDAASTTSCNSFQASPNLVAESDFREREADPLRQQTPAAVQSTEPFLSSKAAIELGPKDLAKMSLKSSDTSPRKTGPQSVPGNNKVQGGIGADYSLDDQRTSSDVQTHNGPDGLQHVHIISRKTENPRSKEDNSEDSLRSLVWPAGDDSKVTSPLKKTPGRLSPEGAPDDSATDRVLRETRGDAVNEVPRGLPMKSYKKFTFERNGGQVVVREKICQKEHRDGNRKTVIEKKVTSRTSSIDLLPPTSSSTVVAGNEPFESTMTRTSRRDDSSDEDDFDIHFDSSHGPLGLLNVMKFMDRDFRTRWQNHPIFQNLSRRPLGMPSELMQNLQGNRRLHSPSLMKMFIERDSRDDDVKSLFERRLSPLLNHSNDRSAFASSLPTDPAARRNLERKLSRGSSLDRSSSRTPRMPPVHQTQQQQQQQSSVVDPMTAAAYEGFSGSFRDIPRYSRTVSDKTIGESHQPSPQSPTTMLRTRTQQGRPSVLHMELNFNTRHPASVGLVHSWSNHGLWQQQNHNQPHQNTTPSRIEMRVHYSTPSSPPLTASPVGMPHKPPKSTSQEQLQTRNPPPPPPPPSSSLEESVSDRINRRSYYHRFSSVDKQTRPSSTIWDQQGVAGSMSAGAGALWEAASPDKPLGISSRAAMTKPPPPPQESNSTSM